MNIVLGEEEHRLTKDARLSRISSAASGNLMFTCTGHQLKWRQIHHLCQKDKAELLITQGLTDSFSRHCRGLPHCLRQERPDHVVHYIVCGEGFNSAYHQAKKIILQQIGSQWHFPSFLSLQSCVAELGRPGCVKLGRREQQDGVLVPDHPEISHTPAGVQHKSDR